MKYVVQYTLPYVHRVMVGIVADNPHAAIKRAEALFDAGDLWQDTDEVPLLFDDYDEAGEGPLQFTVEQELTVHDPWPDPDASIIASRRRAAAFEASRLLVEACRCGSVDWDVLDQAYQAALQATGTEVGQVCARSVKPCAQLAVILEGGIVQSVIADRLTATPAVAVIDYDVEGQEPEDLTLITQSDGSRSKSYVVEPWIEQARINLDEVFLPVDS